MSAQVAADLRAAADVLRRDGWTQGALTDGNGCHCASGALIKATADSDWLEAVRFLRESIGGDWPSIVSWNDAPGRTADEVIAALLAAAQAAEQQAQPQSGDRP